MRCSTSATRSSRACSERTAALAASEARFRSFTSLGSDWYWEQDAEFRFTSISGNFGDVTGVHRRGAPRAARTGTFPDIEAPDGGWARSARGSSRTRRSTTWCCGASIRVRGATYRGDQRRAGVRRRRALRRLPRHRPRGDAAEARRGEHQPARALRHADQPLQSRRVLRAAAPRAVDRAAPRQRARRAVHRPRPLQGRQRHLRPPDRRRGAEDHGAADIATRSARPTPPRASAATSSSCWPRTSRAKATSASSRSVCSTRCPSRSRCSARNAGCPRASASRCSRTTATTPRRCSRRPTSRCTAPRIQGATASRSSPRSTAARPRSASSWARASGARSTPTSCGCSTSRRCRCAPAP